MWSAGVQAPVPKRENQNISDPQRCGREQQLLWRLMSCRQGADQKDDRSDQSRGQGSIDAVSEDRTQPVPVGVMGDDAWNQ